MKRLPTVLRIKVLAEDIRNTDYTDNGNCAIAKACKRLYSTSEVLVTPLLVSISTAVYKYSQAEENKLCRMYELADLENGNDNDWSGTPRDKRIKHIKDFEILAYKVKQ